jgi:hypothetical protein
LAVRETGRPFSFGMVDERVIVAADRREAWAFKMLGL